MKRCFTDSMVTIIMYKSYGSVALLLRSCPQSTLKLSFELHHLCTYEAAFSNAPRIASNLNNAIKKNCNVIITTAILDGKQT